MRARAFSGLDLVLVSERSGGYSALAPGIGLSMYASAFSPSGVEGFMISGL